MVKLLYIMPDAEGFISSMAAICYDADPEDRDRIAKLVRLKHLSTLRFASAVFHISNISLACSHQMVRHKHLDYLQRSFRYVTAKNYDLVVPEKIRSKYLANMIFKTSTKLAWWGYKKLVRLGIKREDARFILPVASVTSMNVVGNLQAWYDFIKLRSTKAAQWEIRRIADAVFTDLNKQVPNIINVDMFKKEK